MCCEVGAALKRYGVQVVKCSADVFEVGAVLKGCPMQAVHF